MTEPQTQAALGMIATLTSMFELDDESDMATAGADQLNAAVETLSQSDVIIGLGRLAIFLLFDHRDRSGDLPEDVLQRVALRLSAQG